ncbi:hypothetical protein SAMN06265365_14811 [Tistlia consotensis]|uniref:DNA transposition protein, AAA+ family ATPase n=1 Tax=Tistlia consotensis USBA 355 TaxID=560819 RepID=A0A1Y6CWP7_9PROT|nr:AAA family ATPase [Tistlia consotensis]SMF82860.1 hypothetical protein SAMN05428998_14812 [Tistlia consotensis USBA 355]SNS31180.1 hypothetical protein SAMN06265365_14811 [Tistlia consotensis]
MSTIDTQDRWTEEAQDELRRELTAYQQAEGLSQAAMAARLAVAEGTISQWRNKRYKGDNAAVAQSVRKGLDSLKSRAKAGATLPSDIGFQDTPTSRKIGEILTFSQIAPTIGVVAMGAGSGKTKTASYYAATNSNVWHVTAEPCTATTYPLLALIAESMGLAERVQTRLSRAIANYVRDKNGLIILDEAQHPNTLALDQLRSIHDSAGVGIALIGNEMVYSRLDGGGRKAAFAQLFSRVGMVLTQPGPRERDICTIVQAWGIVDPEEQSFLKAIAEKPGALRAMVFTLRMATMLAGGAESRKLEHLREAFRRLTPQQVGR